jgi:hypothetical protein
MVDGIKGSREVEKAKTGHLLVGDGLDDGIVEREEHRFCGVEHGICRLEFTEQ